MHPPARTSSLPAAHRALLSELSAASGPRPSPLSTSAQGPTPTAAVQSVLPQGSTPTATAP